MPIGEPTIYLFFGWTLSVASCIPILILTRGRSRAAMMSPGHNPHERRTGVCRLSPSTALSNDAKADTAA